MTDEDMTRRLQALVDKPIKNKQRYQYLPGRREKMYYLG